MHNRFNIENLKSENVIICNLNDNIIIYLPGQKSTDQENDIILDESVFNTYNDLETCVVTSYVELFKINGINIYKKNLGKVINLPKPNIDDQETFYIVDYDVAMTGHIFCGRERKDLLLTGKSFLKDNTKLYTHLTFFESVLNTNPIIYDCSLSIKWKPQAFKNKLSTSIDSVNIINLSGLETISIYDKSNTIRIFPSMGYAYCDINLSKRL
ncbi:MAG: hypothetical protein JWR50_3569, partial [Mucilaginibacter sp.]|nr:hypothetical protein [Mucilaginibacter sp.]